MSTELVAQLDGIFKPASVAVVGAGTSLAKWGGRLFTRLLESDYRGRIYPVNPKHADIFGIKSFARLGDIEGSIDLAILCLPAVKIPGLLKECIQKGVKGAVIITADFAETGEAGKALEMEAVAIARQGGLRFIGPNCMGIWSSAVGLNLALPRKPISGHLAFISQSGTYGITLARIADDKGFGLSKFISFGNQADLLVSEYLEYLAQDPDTKVIALYLEGLKDGRKFFETARRVVQIKPILVFKGGSSPQGARATVSHAASIAGEDRIFDAMCRQVGIIRVTEIEHLFIMAEALICQPLPRGNRIAVVGSGGQGVVTTDALATHGLEVPDFDDLSKAALKAVLPAHAPVPTNPVDFAGGTRTAMKEAEVAHILASLDYIDGLITNVPMHLTGGKSVGDYMRGSIEGAEHFARIPAETGKPVVTLQSKGITNLNIREVLKAARIPIYDSPEDCSRAMAALVKYARIRHSAGNIPGGSAN
ncbi:CoA-binding protein [bacterium]|nr:CoA-binding protein [bacterium]